MADQTTGARSESLHFDATTATAVTCSQCASSIGAYYYESAGAVFCARCKRTIEEKAGAFTTGGGLGRGALYGFGAAVAGAVRARWTCAPGAARRRRA